ncbi:MAG TPA: carbonic anhydrase [Thermoanaerobaculia bacterium]|nr:carbonic anhydrase [Thermoanaerobaculia bacterium]
MKSIAELLDQNRRWSAMHTDADPHFFQHLSEIQRPDYLWIGCADSRVPANEIVGLAPGELFVHRNVANIVVPGDPNCMSAVQYAIDVLNVRHVIVCGHYGCGGVRAALDDEYGGAAHVERWLLPLRELALQQTTELSLAGDYEARWARLCELNVVEQVRRLQSSDVLVRARLRDMHVSVYGMVYGLRDGLLRELVTAA